MHCTMPLSESDRPEHSCGRLTVRSNSTSPKEADLETSIDRLHFKLRWSFSPTLASLSSGVPDMGLEKGEHILPSLTPATAIPCSG